MTTNHHPVEGSRRLSMEEARRLLDRAGQIDAAQLSVAELRHAAEQAGIAPSAFDPALAELEASDAVVTAPDPKRGKRQIRSAVWGAALMVALILVALLSLIVERMVPGA